MGESDTPGSQGHLVNENTGKSNVAGDNKSGDPATPRAISDSRSDHQEVDKRNAPVQDTDMENLAGAMSSLRFVPRNVRLASKKSGLPPR